VNNASTVPQIKQHIEKFLTKEDLAQMKKDAMALGEIGNHFLKDTEFS